MSVIIYMLMTINFSFLLSPLILCQNSSPESHSWSCFSVDVVQSFVTWSVQDGVSPHGHLPTQLCKISEPANSSHAIYNAIITPTSSARNLGYIFDSTLSMSDHISAVSKSCFLSIRALRRIRNTLDHTTAHTIATFLIHSKLDYYNSLFLNLPQSQVNRLQLILNSSARAVSHPNSATFTPLLKSLHWLKIEQRIEYKVLSITYKTLLSGQPSYLHIG